MIKTALITGATSGIGAAAARLFCRNGWQVVGTGRRADRLSDLVKEVGERFYPLSLDIRDASAINAALASLPEAFRNVTLLINNAGLALGTDPAQQAQISQWQQMIDTNITGLITITHILLPGLIEQRGAIINLSSVAATYPYPGGNVYGGTKAFVRQFSLGLRSDLSGTGVRVTSVEPSMVETDFTTVRTGSQETSNALYKGVDPMTGDDIADTLLWIADQPAHVSINIIELMPVRQSFGGFQTFRDPNS